MPLCHTIVLCSGSSHDTLSNNYTLFNLIEQLRVPIPRITLPIDQVTFWQVSPDDFGKTFEVVLDLHAPSGDEVLSSRPIRLKATHVSHRVRAQGFVVPDESGTYQVRVRVRGVDDDGEGEGAWELQPARWPVRVTITGPNDVVAADDGDK